MNYSDDSYVAMLLTLALSPDREEYARPFSVAEFRRMEGIIRESGRGPIGKLLEIDISGMMLYLGLKEEEAYRAYTLLHRTVQLSYALESFARQGISVITCYDEGYPQRLKRKLRDAAPPVFYHCGMAALEERPAVAIMGISGVKTGPDVRAAIERIVGAAVDKGYAIITGGELGVSRVAAGAVGEREGRLLEVLGGGMLEHIHEDGIAEMIALGCADVLSLEHPEAMFTASHATARNKLLFSLADATFIFNTDGRRGESEALQNRYCDWIYAWTGCRENAALISKGAIPIDGVDRIDFETMSRHWSSSSAEQLSLFDML